MLRCLAISPHDGTIPSVRLILSRSFPRKREPMVSETSVYGPPLSRGERKCWSNTSSFAGARNPVRSRQRHACHGGSFHGQRHQVFGLEIVHMRLAAGARDGLHLERHDRKKVRKLAAGENRIEPRRQRGVLRGDADRVAAFMPVVVGTGGGAERAILFLEMRIVVAEGD